MKLTMNLGDMLYVESNEELPIGHISNEQVLMVQDDQWVKVDIIDHQFIVTMCGLKDGKIFDRKSMKFENGEIVKSDEPT